MKDDENIDNALGQKEINEAYPDGFVPLLTEIANSMELQVQWKD
jgi:hypothetical protein